MPRKKSPDQLPGLFVFMIGGGKGGRAGVTGVRACQYCHI
jgi:hypothetical protein